jgi:hypothetical protein
MTIDWFVYFMTKHPEIQSKCQEEIDRVVGENGTYSLDYRFL